MARKIICPKCNTIFDEDILKQKNSETICLVCGESLLGDEDTASPSEPPSFGEGIELSENDSFDEDMIDFWWSQINEPGKLGESDTGDVDTTCTKCGRLSFAPYPIAKCGEYLLISSGFRGRCHGCGNEMKNHILSKRPADWVDPRKRNLEVVNGDNEPRCPICNSTRIHKISLTNKAISVLAFDVLAAGHVSKTYKCDNCGAKF